MRKLIALVTLVLVINVGVIQAGESSSGGVLGEKQSSPSGSILEKLNELKTEIASKAAQIKAEVGKKIENKAWSGVITSKNIDLITIKSDKDDRKISVDEYTLFTTGKIKDKGLLKDLAVGDFVVAIGDVDDKNILQAKKVLRSKKIVIDKRLIWGQITGFADTMIKLRSVDGNKELKTGINTDFWLGSKEASIQDAKKDKFLLAVIEGSTSASLNVSTIYFIPTTGYFKPEKKASMSAVLNTATRSATKSAVKR